MRFLPLVCLLVACIPRCGENTRQQSGTNLPEPAVRLAILTDLQGNLEPCGCSEDQLGGLDHLAALLRQEGSPPLVVAGETFAPVATEANHENNTKRWKNESVQAILERLHVVATTELENAPSSQGVATRRAWQNAETLTSGGATIHFARVFDAPVASDNDVHIALVHGSRRDAVNVAEQGFDFVIASGLQSDAPLPPQATEGGTLLHAGQQGAHIAILELYRPTAPGSWVDLSEWTVAARRSALAVQEEALTGRLSAWRAEGRPATELRPFETQLAELRTERESLRTPTLPPGRRGFKVRLLDVTRSGAPDATSRAVLAALDERINQANQIAYADRVPATGSPRFVGSAACASCHAEAYSWWQNHPHGRAYRTLTERHKEFHLDCVSCHVTGYDQPGGSSVTRLGDGGVLQNVGCESCHGPGELHLSNPAGSPLRSAVTENICVECHNSEHSTRFNFEAYRATLLVPGHGARTE